MQPKRTQQVTLPTLSFKLREVAYVRFESELVTSDSIREDDKGTKPATVARVIDLETGAECMLISPALVTSALARHPTGYVGKCFELRVGRDKVAGKNYKPAEVYEIEDPKDHLIEPVRATQA